MSVFSFFFVLCCACRYAQDALQDTAGWVFFVTLVVIVSFNIVNLYVAVISGAYKDVSDRRVLINKLKRSRKRHKKLSLMNASMDGGMDKNATFDENAFGIEVQPTRLKSVKLWFVAKIKRAERMKFRLNPLAKAARDLTMYPVMIDECGAPVPASLLVAAKDRNLKIRFGPGASQWSLWADGGDVMLMPPVIESAEKKPQDLRALYASSVDKERQQVCAPKRQQLLCTSQGYFAVHVG